MLQNKKTTQKSLILFGIKSTNPIDIINPTNIDKITINLLIILILIGI